jgi:uncharacterized protein YjbJ (UPF0337 family)
MLPSAAQIAKFRKTCSFSKADIILVPTRDGRWLRDKVERRFDAGDKAEAARVPCASEQTARGTAHSLAKSVGTLFDASGGIEMNQEMDMNNDQVKGRMKQAQGKTKQVAGKVVGNKTLEEKGKIQNAVGKVQASYGDLKQDLKKGTQDR